MSTMFGLSTIKMVENVMQQVAIAINASKKFWTISPWQIEFCNSVEHREQQPQIPGISPSRTTAKRAVVAIGL